MTSTAVATLDCSVSAHSLPALCRSIFTVFVDALAEALAPRIANIIDDRWEDMVAAKVRADDQPLSIKKAARAIRISDATLQHACNEPEGSPWHLKHTRGNRQGGVGSAPYYIKRENLGIWDRDQRQGFVVEIKNRNITR